MKFPHCVSLLFTSSLKKFPKRRTFLSNYQHCVMPSWVTRRFFGTFVVLSQKSYSNTLESYWICNLKVTSYLKNWQKLDLWDLFIKLSALRDAVVGYSAVFRNICCFISKILFQHFRELLNLQPKGYKLPKKLTKTWPLRPFYQIISAARCRRGLLGGFSEDLLFYLKNLIPTL